MSYKIIPTETFKTQVKTLQKKYTWKTKMYGTTCQLSGGYGFPDSFQGSVEGELPFIKVSNMSLPGNEMDIVNANNYVSIRIASSMGWKPFPASAVVFAKVGAALKLNCRRILIKPTLIDNNMMAAIPQDGFDSAFLYHFRCVIDFGDFVQDGALPSINQEQVGSIKLPDINKDEQRLIAEILDTIDEAIQKTEALISKLKAMKQGLLQDLLTRGLDKNGKLRNPKTHPEQFKDSPLGMIPREWDVGRIDQFLNPTDGIKPGPFGSSITKIMYTPEGYKVYGQEQVIAGDLTVGDYYISTDKFNELRTFEIHENDILMSLVGTVGRVLVVRSPFKPGIINPRLIRFRPVLSKGNPIFLRELLMSDIVKKQLASLFQGGTMPVLSATIMRKLILAKPKQYEQEMIAKILLTHDASIRTEEQYCDKLKLQKKGLMHDLLTSKVRVEV